ncbi:MAG: polysaccharide pyruvyl transferase family protein [Atribacterota bacterium]
MRAGGSSITHLFFLGYYGFGNWGDELSLLATLRAVEKLRRNGGQFVCQVLYRTTNPLFDFPPGVEVVSRECFPQILKQVKNSQALMVGGGSLLQDTTSFRSLAYYYSLLRFALFWGKPILFYGCGLGPFKRSLSRWMVSGVLRRSFLLLRDEESCTLAYQLGTRPSRVVLGVDPVFLLQDLLPEKKGSAEKVAVFLRPVDREKEENLFRSLKALLAFVPEMEFVAFHHQLDGEFVSRLAKRLGVRSFSFDHLMEVLAYFQNVDMVFSMRFHPLVLSTMLDIPWVAFDVDPKIRALASLFSGENLLSFQGLSPEALIAMYTRRHLLAEKNKVAKALLSTRFGRMEEKLFDFLQLLG